jgi:pimeloyl-ACP methyl ester carboxylesterase
MNHLEFPHVDWREGNSKNGVTLREFGRGKGIFIFPGMEGSGESCLHLAAPVIEQASSLGKPYRMLLVDYAHEAHKTFDELVETIHNLILEAAGQEQCIFWAQSYGNLLATGVSRRGGINIQKLVFVSPFTALPPLTTHLGTLLMYVTPTFLYRATIGPLGRYIFGPVGDQGKHPFFDALRRATSGVVRRRTGWLRSRNFSAHFTETPSPAKVWLGKRDRLVNLDEQSAFFTELARNRSDYQMSMIEGSGHVVLPGNVVSNVRIELLEWLVAGT